MDQQIIKIAKTKANQDAGGVIRMTDTQAPCPYELLHIYTGFRGGYKQDDEPFFRLSDGKVIKPFEFNLNLKNFIKFAGFNEKTLCQCQL